MDSVSDRIQQTEDRDIMRMSIDEAQDKLFNLAQQVKSEDDRIILTQNGQAIAAIVSIEAFAFLERAIEKAEDETDREDCQRILLETQPDDWISLEELKKELGL